MCFVQRFTSPLVVLPCPRLSHLCHFLFPLSYAHRHLTRPDSNRGNYPASIIGSDKASLVVTGSPPSKWPSYRRMGPKCLVCYMTLLLSFVSCLLFSFQTSLLLVVVVFCINSQVTRYPDCSTFVVTIYLITRALACILSISISYYNIIQSTCGPQQSPRSLHSWLFSRLQL